MSSATVYGLNLSSPASKNLQGKKPARLAIFGLASDFGCQVQMTNIEEDLLDALGMVDLVYWQLVSSAECPHDYDIAIVEGAACTEEHVEQLLEIRATARCVITIGACAVTGGIPGMATEKVARFAAEVYGDTPASCGRMASPRPVSDIIKVDFQVPGCPIDPKELLSVLQRALLGGNAQACDKTMCGDCRLNEGLCFYEQGRICLGLVTRAGCGAFCIKQGKPCNGCRGLAANANVDSAREIVRKCGLDMQEFEKRIEVFNTVATVARSKESR